MELLQVEGLTVRYPGFTLRAASLSVAAGESVAILGESGSGKTTLARAIAGLIGPAGEVSGRVLLDGRDWTAMPERARKPLRMAELAICFQNSAEWLNPALNLAEQLAEILGKRYPRREHAARAAARMERVGLRAEDLARYPRELSGGMVQRFMLACALALEPKLILLDEPTSALDYRARGEMIELLRSVRQEKGTALLLITHDVVVARALCERTLVLYSGEIVEAGPTEKLISAAHHPYTYGLMQSFVELHPYRDLWGIRRPDPERETPGERCCFYPSCTQAIAACACARPVLEEGPPGRFVACHRGGIIRILSATGVCKRFGAQRVLDGVDIKVYAGEVVALVGPSGVGKTTLCAILSGFLPCDAGEIRFDGEAADFGALHKSFGGLQLVMQDSEGALNARLTVGEAVAEPLRLAGVDAAERQTRAARALGSVGLPQDAAFLGKRVRELSGGQKQRVNLARALTMQPRLLVADEPTSMLDASSKANVLRMLKGLQNEAGCALLVVTHDLDSARKIADRVYVLRGGKALRVDAEALEAQFEEEANGQQ